MHRFFISMPIREGIACFDQSEEKHITKVLRLKPGDQVLGVDGSGKEYLISLMGNKNNYLQGRVEEEHTVSREPGFKLTLVQGLVKTEKMDLIIQKAVELGVYEIIPLLARYSVVKLNEDKIDKRMEKWNRIVIEACKQSGRSIPPKIRTPETFKSMIVKYSNKNTILLYEKEKDTSLKIALKELSKRDEAFDSINLWIGPEGGFSEAEIELARSNNFIIAGLGPRILRSETAALVATAIVLYEFNGLG